MLVVESLGDDPQKDSPNKQFSFPPPPPGLTNPCEDRDGLETDWGHSFYSWKSLCITQKPSENLRSSYFC